MDNLERYNLIGDHQFGFRQKRACLAQMLKYYEDILQASENGSNVDSIYLDFENAFDKLDFGLLCHRLI